MIENSDYASITGLAKAEGVNQSYACRLLRLTLLAPDIVEEILNGTQTDEFSLGWALAGFSLQWAQQRGALGRQPDSLCPHNANSGRRLDQVGHHSPKADVISLLRDVPDLTMWLSTATFVVASDLD